MSEKSNVTKYVRAAAAADAVEKAMAKRRRKAAKALERRPKDVLAPQEEA